MPNTYATENIYSYKFVIVFDNKNQNEISLLEYDKILIKTKTFLVMHWLLFCICVDPLGFDY